MNLIVRRILKCFLCVLSSLHVLFYLLFLHDINRKAQDGRHLWPRTREMGKKQSKRMGAHPWLVSEGTKPEPRALLRAR